ncbi:uncharacterized protein LOC122381686 [Amphibalanus amphitrite]|uniref:uncharacterized protein LOC122381686 n=1 Tax=Amphibalanus amphitrite TaxID=1232801 RepID=UPI001C90CB77|nr:uncharacterized protein LOC122381686 [Amphibalanus amphitrite]
MSFLRPMNLVAICRGVSTSVCMNNVRVMISAQQQARMMKKFMAAAKKKERMLQAPAAVDSGAGDTGDDGTASSTDPVRIRPLRAGSARHRHRLEALSAIYLQRLTELLCLGELLPDLADTGLAVTRVQLSGNMRLLYVFWTCSAGADERRIASRLEEAGRPLRAALTQQRVTGHVPGIKFVRDVESSLLQEVERRLAVADFGPDFVPTDPTHLVKRQGVLGLPLTAQHTEHLLGSDSLDGGSSDDSAPDSVFEELEMPHTTGGLNRAAILAEVEERLLKASALHRQVELHPEAVTPTVPAVGAATPAQREQLSFEKFTKQRKWARMRRNKVSSTVDLRDWESSRRRRPEDLQEDREEEEDCQDREDAPLWDGEGTQRHL